MHWIKTLNTLLCSKIPRIGSNSFWGRAVSSVLPHWFIWGFITPVMRLLHLWFFFSKPSDVVFTIWRIFCLEIQLWKLKLCQIEGDNMNEWVCVSLMYVYVLHCQVEMQWAEVYCVVVGGQSKRGSDTLENSLKGPFHVLQKSLNASLFHSRPV